MKARKLDENNRSYQKEAQSESTILKSTIHILQEDMIYTQDTLDKVKSQWNTSKDIIKN